jgi:hypothetical protein
VFETRLCTRKSSNALAMIADTARNPTMMPAIAMVDKAFVDDGMSGEIVGWVVVGVLEIVGVVDESLVLITSVACFIACSIAEDDDSIGNFEISPLRSVNIEPEEASPMNKVPNDCGMDAVCEVAVCVQIFQDP